MSTFQQWLVGAFVILVLLPLAGWAGAAYGRRAVRKYPGLAIALVVLTGFFKLDPPPPPKAERVTRNEDGAGDPPGT